MMNILNRKVFLEAMALFLVTIQRETSEEVQGFYYEMLKDLSNKCFLKAIELIVKTEKNIYPGTNIVALIREKATEDINKSLPGEAWAEVIDQVRRVGSYGTPTFSSPLVEKAVEAIGWKEICMADSADSIIRAHFLKIYESYINRQVQENLLGLPSGLTSQVQKLLKTTEQKTQ